MNTIKGLVKTLLSFLFPEALGMLDVPENERNRNMDYVEHYRRDIESRKAIEKRADDLRHERYESGKNNGKMDEI